ncbi:hypothetical protein Ancab_017653 [Ancistrocladus abbreviatus]
MPTYPGCFRILRWLADEEEQNHKKNLPRIQYLIIEMSRMLSVTNPSFSSLYFFPNTRQQSILNIKHKLFIAAVIDIDTSGIHALEDLYRSLEKRDVKVKKRARQIIKSHSSFLYAANTKLVIAI